MNAIDSFRKSYQAHGLDSGVVKIFQDTVRDYYHKEARDLPWRKTSDPYAILVSEVMLQQTQVERAIGKYAGFLATFPSVTALADAPLESVLRAWQGLGYNRRALSLKKGAEVIVERFNGQVPESIDALHALPGIGPYTARAIALFAFGTPSAFIETNVRSVFIHFFFHDRTGVRDCDILPLIEKTLDKKNPRDWYYALMDYGAFLKKTQLNPSRKSAHHAKQTPFHGSNREIRSMILREILARPGISEHDMVGLKNASPEQIRRNLADLESEGFIRKSGQAFSVA